MKKSAPKSKYSKFIAEALAGMSRATSKTLNNWRPVYTSGGRALFSDTKTKTLQEQIKIDDTISKLYLTVSLAKSISFIEFVSPANIVLTPSSKTSNIWIYQINDPSPGLWLLQGALFNGSISYKLTVAFKEPIAFNTVYLYQEKSTKYAMINKPLVGKSTFTQPILLMIPITMNKNKNWN